ncbi:fasciclin domain-containing protein [Pilimelia columellifera]|uniref:Fasciclin domain-containing protein n=1 Tax=Pilimelia columellifera subsp. columellifera TaxID=706583 RepID=A0ABN3NHA0_9ACTN
MRATRFAAIATFAVVAASVAACDSTNESTSDTGGSATATTAPASPTAAQFGAACSAVPADPSNPGSFAGMADDPVATAASNNPVLKTLVTAVTKAQLVDSLNTAPAVTVFAPTNDAFGKIPAATLDKVLADKAQLTKILTYHVVPQRLAPEQLAGTHTTLEGGAITVAGSGESFTVNGASGVVCGNVQTANATVYIVDSVLMPKA